MFHFFVHHPRVALVLLGCAAVSGAIIAGRLHSDQSNPISLATVSKQTDKTQQDDLVLRPLRTLELNGSHLEQRLEDGSRAVLTINVDLQQRFTKLLKSYEVPYAGAVLYDLQSKEIVVLAGYSQLDATVGPENLCLKPWAPAASVFKLVTAAALLERGVRPSTRICYHGGLRGLTAEHLKERPSRDTQCRSFGSAIAHSTNAVIAKLAIRYLDTKLLQTWTERFAFNTEIPIALPSAPSRAEIPAERVEFARTAAGFWHTDISVLHGAVIAGTIGSEGIRQWPHIIRHIVSPTGEIVTPQRADKKRVLRKHTAAALTKMMIKTTTAGTARRGFFNNRHKPLLPGIAVAGKTGSLTRDNPYLNYSWFVGFAPAENPKAAFAVLLGNPPKWRIKASTAARMLLSLYFHERS